MAATSAVTWRGFLVVGEGRRAAEFGRAGAGSDATRARELAALEVHVARFQSPIVSDHRELIFRSNLVDSFLLNSSAVLWRICTNTTEMVQPRRWLAGPRCCKFVRCYFQCRKTNAGCSTCPVFCSTSSSSSNERQGVGTLLCQICGIFGSTSMSTLSKAPLEGVWPWG